MLFSTADSTRVVLLWLLIEGIDDSSFEVSGFIQLRGLDWIQNSILSRQPKHL